MNWLDVECPMPRLMDRVKAGEAGRCARKPPRLPGSTQSWSGRSGASARANTAAASAFSMPVSWRGAFDPRILRCNFRRNTGRIWRCMNN